MVWTICLGNSGSTQPRSCCQNGSSGGRHQITRKCWTNVESWKGCVWNPQGMKWLLIPVLLLMVVGCNGGNGGHYG